MNKKTLYLMLGYPGAGKTTTADIVAELTGAVHLSTDELRLQLFPNPAFTEEEHQLLYKTFDKQTEQLLLEGKSVIYDANLNRYQHRQEKYDIAKRTGAEVVLLWIQTQIPLAKERASNESRSRLWRADEHPDQMFDRIVDIFEEPSADEPYLALDGTKINTAYVSEKLHVSHG